MWANPLPALRAINSSPIARRHEKTGPVQDRQIYLNLKRLDDAHLPTLKKLIKTACKSSEIAGAETID